QAGTGQSGTSRWRDDAAYRYIDRSARKVPTIRGHFKTKWQIEHRAKGHHVAPIKVAVIIIRRQVEGILVLGEVGCALGRVVIEILCKCIESIKLAPRASQLSAEGKRLEFRSGRRITNLHKTVITEGRNRAVLRAYN